MPLWLKIGCGRVCTEVLRCAQANHTSRKDSDTYDIYLLPPGEDVETCTSWLRMRNRDGRYNLMFEEWVTDGPFIISPRITFEVGPVRHTLSDLAPSDASGDAPKQLCTQIAVLGSHATGSSVVALLS